MGLSRISDLLLKTPQKHDLFIFSPRKLESSLFRSLSTSNKNTKISTSPLTWRRKTKYPSWPLLNPHFTNPGFLHSSSEQIQVLISPNSQIPETVTSKITEETQKICELLSKNPNSKVEALLDEASIEVSPSLLLEVLKRLSNAGALALSFFGWAENQKGFKYTTDSYNALIESLGKIKQFKLVWNLVDEMKQKELLSKETFALISRRYARARKVKEAIKAFERMEEFGLKIESSDFNRLIDTLSKSRQVEKAQEVFDKMKKRRFEADLKSYTILLEGWGKEQNLLRLDEVYREMKDEGFEPDVVTFSIVIHAYCKARKFNEAIALFREMEAKRCAPSPHVFCTLINGLGGEKRLSEALEFFERSKASGLALEAPTYNAVVGAYCWSMRMQDAFRMIEEMRRCGVGPNSRTYDIILHHLIKAGRKEEAYSVFQKMSGEDGCEPTVSAYEIIVRMFCNERRLDRAIDVWNKMESKGVLPGMHMFSILIDSLCRVNKLDEACKYFQQMLDVGIRPTAKLFSNLKQALLDGGKKDTAVLLEQKIDKQRKTALFEDNKRAKPNTVEKYFKVSRR